MLEAEYKVVLSTPSRFISYENDAAESQQLGGAISDTIEDSTKLYFGDIDAELFTHTADEYNVKAYIDNSQCMERNGLVNTGYSGLITIPFEIKNLAFTSLITTRDTNDTSLSKVRFNGWVMNIK